MGAPDVSVIVPLTGGPAQALRCFQGIAAQPEEPSFEVIVVDDGSVGLEALLAGLEGDVEIVRTGRRVGFAAAARLGAERARGPIAVLVRGAAQPADGWLAPLARALEDPSVGLATSATAGEPGTHPTAALAAAARSADLIRAAAAVTVPEALAIAALAVELAARGLRSVAVPASAVIAPGSRTGSGRRRPGEPPEVTIVIPTLDAGSERLRACVGAVQATTDAPHEIVIVDNGSPPQGFSAPVNAGIRAARTPYLVVMNDDVEPLPGWWAPLRGALDAGAEVAFPMTVQGPMRHDFAAWCFALARERLGPLSHGPGELFDPSLVIWYQDTDLLHRLRKLGRPPVLVPSAQIRHGLSETVGSEDPELSAWIRAQIAVDRERFLRKHPDAVLHGAALEAA